LTFLHWGSGYEADDVIGTLAKKAEKEGFTTYMMTPDKDFGQLVSENIFMFRPGRGGNPPEVWGVEKRCVRSLDSRTSIKSWITSV
jgi:DNA polymerase-1